MKILICNRAEFWLRLYNSERPEGERLVREYPCAVGQPSYETPDGPFVIQNRIIDPGWWLPPEDWVPQERWGEVVPGLVDGKPNPENPLKSRWLGVDGGVGIHGTDVTESLGTAASHGCIRLSVPEVEDLFDRVPVGTPIAIL